MRNRGVYILYLTVCLLVLAASIPVAGLRKHTIKGFAQGTDYTITYYAADSLVSKRAVDSVLALIDSSMSLYKPYSLINHINAGERGTYTVDEHFRRVLKRSQEIYKDSRGIFDITVAPLVQLWGFGPKTIDHFPDSMEIKQALACVGMNKVKLKKNRLEKKIDCAKLDVNGIAQGYSVDVLAELLESKGITSYVVELGGELRVKGPKPDGTAMHIGIERPAAEDREEVVINDVLEIVSGAVTTAGNYRKFLQEGERRVSHHIDPKTGIPFETGIISATIYAKDAITADGYDNVFMAMNAAAAVDFAERRSNMEVFVIYKDAYGVVRDTMSTGFKQLITKIPKER